MHLGEWRGIFGFMNWVYSRISLRRSNYLINSADKTKHWFPLSHRRSTTGTPLSTKESGRLCIDYFNRKSRSRSLLYLAGWSSQLVCCVTVSIVFDLHLGIAAWHLLSVANGVCLEEEERAVVFRGQSSVMSWLLPDTTLQVDWYEVTRTAGCKVNMVARKSR